MNNATAEMAANKIRIANQKNVPTSIEPSAKFRENKQHKASNQWPSIRLGSNALAGFD